MTTIIIFVRYPELGLNNIVEINEPHHEKT